MRRSRFCKAHTLLCSARGVAQFKMFHKPEVLARYKGLCVGRVAGVGDAAPATAGATCGGTSDVDAVRRSVGAACAPVVTAVALRVRESGLRRFAASHIASDRRSAGRGRHERAVLHSSCVARRGHVSVVAVRFCALNLAQV